MNTKGILFPGEVQTYFPNLLKQARNIRIRLIGISALLIVVSIACHLLSAQPVRSSAASLAGYLYWLGIGGGTAVILTILRLTRAEWRRSVARSAELLTLLVPLAIILYPIASFWRRNLMLHDSGISNIHVLWPWEQWDQVWILDLVIALPMFVMVCVVFWFGISPDLRRVSSSVLPGRLRVLSAVQTVFLFGGLVWFGWGFGMTRVPGWESTLFGPYFIVSSLFHGAAALAVFSILVRRVFRLEKWITPHSLDQLSKLMIGFTLLWFYVNFAEFLTVWYGHIPLEMNILKTRTIETFPVLFGIVGVMNFPLPLLYFSIPRLRRSISGVFIICTLILIAGFGEWFLAFAAVPGENIAFGILFGRMLLLPGIFGLVMALILSHVGPLSIWEIEEGILYRGARRIGEKMIPTYILGDLPKDKLSHEYKG